MVPGGLKEAEAQLIVDAMRRVRSRNRRYTVLLVITLFQTVMLGLYAGLLLNSLGCFEFIAGMERELLLAGEVMVCGLFLTSVVVNVVLLSEISSQDVTDRLILKLAGVGLEHTEVPE